jgi:hypothetical protein
MVPIIDISASSGAITAINAAAVAAILQQVDGRRC